LICKIDKRVELWIYDEFGYNSVKLLVGNTPGKYAGRALAVGISYVGIKRFDEYTSAKMIKLKVDDHIEVLTKAGQKLDMDTLERIYQEAHSQYNPSILIRAENFAVEIGTSLVKHAAIVLKDAAEKR
jgi:hypothetical protein